MTTTRKHQIKVVNEYLATDLGVPFEVVLLNSVKQLIDEETGEVQRVIIPNFRGLMKCIAITRILNARKLSGNEIKFVRKAFKLPAKHVAEMIDVTPEHLSRCESDQRLLSASAEKCFRVSVFLEQFKVLDKLDNLCEKNEELLEKVEKVREAMTKIGIIIGEMKISSAFSLEPLVFKFHTVSEAEGDLFEDDPNADWLSNEREFGRAA